MKAKDYAQMMITEMIEKYCRTEDGKYITLRTACTNNPDVAKDVMYYLTVGIRDKFREEHDAVFGSRLGPSSVYLSVRFAVDKEFKQKWDAVVICLQKHMLPMVDDAMLSASVLLDECIRDLSLCLHLYYHCMDSCDDNGNPTRRIQYTQNDLQNSPDLDDRYPITLDSYGLWIMASHRNIDGTSIYNNQIKESVLKAFKIDLHAVLAHDQYEYHDGTPITLPSQYIADMAATTAGKPGDKKKPMNRRKNGSDTRSLMTADVD